MDDYFLGIFVLIFPRESVKNCEQAARLTACLQFFFDAFPKERRQRVKNHTFPPLFPNLKALFGFQGPLDSSFDGAFNPPNFIFIYAFGHIYVLDLFVLFAVVAQLSLPGIIPGPVDSAAISQPAMHNTKKTILL